MKKLLLASVLMSALSAFAASSDQLSKTQSTLQQSPPLITESNRENFERSHRQAIDSKEIAPINCSVDSSLSQSKDVAFNVSVELYKEGKNKKKEVIFDATSSSANAGKVAFSNTQTHTYIESITLEEQKDLTSEEISMEYHRPAPKVILTPGKLVTGFNAYVSPSTKDNKTIINLSYANTDLLEMKDFTVDGNTINLPTSSLYTILQNRVVELNKPTVVELNDGIKMSVVVTKI